MYEIIMLFAFFYAATCQLLPQTNRSDKPGLLRKQRIKGKKREGTKASVPKQKMCQMKPVRGGNREPALHVRQDSLRRGWERANGIKPNRIH